MGSVDISDIKLTSLKRIHLSGGDVLHGMKASEEGYSGFGEAYFSEIKFGEIKAWKKHTEMTMNLVVPIGEVKFVFADQEGLFREEIIGSRNYYRLTVPPGIWFGFQGLFENFSMILNISNIEHSPLEVVRKELDDFKYNWELIK